MAYFDGLKDRSRRIAVEEGQRVGDNTFKPFRKTTVTYAARIMEPFDVDTPEGLHSGKEGDWLAVGAHGEMYPIDAAVFADTYEPVE